MVSDYILRLRTPSYTSPSGVIFDLQFDDVERSGSKKAAVHELPQQNIADVQDLGNNSTKFPLTVYFTGDDYDTRADNFYSALEENGPGTLFHPRYGNLNVLPLSFGQVEKFVNGLGRAEFTIDFIQVPTDIIYPVTSINVTEAISINVTSLLADATAIASGEFLPVDAADIANVATSVTDGLDSFVAALDSVASEIAQVQADIEQAVASVTDTIDTLINAPLELFGAIVDIINTPARIFTNIIKKVNGYGEFITQLVLSIPESYAEALTFAQSLFGALGGVAVSSTIGEIFSREEALLIIQSIELSAQKATEAIEATESAIDEYTAPPEIVAGLQEQIAMAKASLTERSFSLRTERKVTFEQSRCPIELVYDLYGNLDKLDEFLTTNDLQGDEIILLPAGREVSYYV